MQASFHATKPQTTLKPKPAIGDSSLAVVQYIAQRNNIPSVSLFHHGVAVNWRQKHADADKVNHLDESCFRHNDGESSPMQTFKTNEFIRLHLTDLKKQVSPDRVHSVGSHVSIDGKSFHIPMMNFHPETEDALSSIVTFMNAVRRRRPDLVPEGVLVSSGRYYHYYGFKVITEDQFHEFLSLFLMPAILVSPRYIGHSLHEKQCSLRLTNDMLYKPQLPVVIQRI